MIYRRFLRGLMFSLLGMALVTIANELSTDPILNEFTPLVIAVLLAADKAVREWRKVV